MFETLLIANRGEIACRIIRTARRMGLRTVAVYSDADAGAQHVAMADVAVRIGGAAPRESYLRGEAVIAAAKATGAGAVHPGYGFLSENAGFAEACGAAGLVFVGPPAAAIRAMGGKSESKALMVAAGVPVVPGYHGEAQDFATLEAAAEAIGFPVLIKASAGGGGKGMRVVTEAGALRAGIEAAQREGASSFGDPRLLIEKYLTRPRHVEVQVFADGAGNTLYLFDRDCSVQRRHQKVIEEAPAPGLSDEMRRAMGEAAVQAARAVGYVGAGTVEFIVEGGMFAFMEMNTRLQVEHPVTEAITGLDLVEWQLRVAAGEALPWRQEDLRARGHAVEARVYAEDPAADFRPSVGRLVHLRLPEGVRVDAGVRRGDRISPDYDPMIAKVIAYGADRGEALRRLAGALGETEVAGVRTNLGFVRGIVTHPAFAAGELDTGFIARHGEVLFAEPVVDDHAVAAAAMAAMAGFGEGWRMNLPAVRRVLLGVGERRIAVETVPGGLVWDGGMRAVSGAGGMVTVDGVTRRVGVFVGEGEVTVFAAGAAIRFAVVDPLAPPVSEAVGAGRVMSAIPGRVVVVLVGVGETVAKGQVLVVVEAMKMEMALAAGREGVVTRVACAVGEMVEEGVELVEIGDLV